GRGRGGDVDGAAGPEDILEARLDAGHQLLEVRATVADHRADLRLEHLWQHLRWPGQEEPAERRELDFRGCSGLWHRRSGHWLRRRKGPRPTLGRRQEGWYPLHGGTCPP